MREVWAPAPGRGSSLLPGAGVGPPDRRPWGEKTPGRRAAAPVGGLPVSRLTGEPPCRQRALAVDSFWKALRPYAQIWLTRLRSAELG